MAPASHADTDPTSLLYLLLDAGVWVLIKDQISRLCPAGKRRKLF